VDLSLHLSLPYLRIELIVPVAVDLSAEKSDSAADRLHERYPSGLVERLEEKEETDLSRTWGVRSLTRLTC
jgi:hypothetical protein